MRNLNELIELASRHVEQGRHILQRQRDLIESGTSVPGALELLATFERSQAIFEDDLARLMSERDKK
jgi:hypothetical protein